MKKMIIDGREIKTNYRQSVNGYPFSDGRAKKTMIAVYAFNQENDTELLHKLVARGYTTITFYWCTTRVKGYYNIMAYCK